MDKLENYRQILKKTLTDFAVPHTSRPESVETQLLFDTQNDHYQVLRVGWKDRTQIFLVVFHFDIKDSKIWLHQNASDYDIIGDIERAGVPKEDIVLAFHSPYMRQFTEYAVA
jgi:hypothetical protein